MILASRSATLICCRPAMYHATVKVTNVTAMFKRMHVHSEEVTVLLQLPLLNSALRDFFLMSFQAI